MNRTTAVVIAIFGSVVALIIRDYLALVLFALLFWDAMKTEAK